MKLIEITKEQYEICKKFAHDSFHTNIDAYRRRNQFDQEKIIFDIEVGKIAEFGVYNLLSYKMKVSLPDTQIYSARNKSFDADLKLEKYDIHVKSQHINQSSRFGESWMFQKSDTLTYDPTDRDVICLCIVSDAGVSVKKFLKASNLVGKYGSPISKKLESKHALYFDDIKDIKFKL